ncbi:MAG: DUF4340 domain-containing protein [Firmicutes bacterium]|nr:DUF4340 domain-containing protein [Bacillota bacterium]
MSRKAKVIGGVLVLLILAGAIVFVSIRNKQIAASQPEESSEGLVLKNLWETAREDISSIELQTETDTITLLPDGYNSTGTMQWVLQGHEDWKLINTYQQIVSMAALLPAYKLIEEDVTDPSRLADFGLDTPKSVMTVHLKDGSEKKAYVGILSSDKEYTFCRIEGDQSVYATNADYAAFASYTRNSIRLRTITEMNITDDAKITYIFVQQKGGLPVEIEKDETVLTVNRPEGGAIYPLTDNVFKQPYTNPYIQVGADLEFNYLQHLTTPELVETIDADCQDFSVYGLSDEEPEYRERIITRTGDSEENYKYTTTDYLFGYTYGDQNQYIYFREAGSTLVLGVDAACMSGRHFDPYFFVNKLIYINSISNIESGTFVIDGKTYEFQEKRSDIPEGGTAADRIYSYRINGVLIEDEPFLAFFRSMIELIPSYEIRGEKPAYDESDKVELTYRFWDGTSETFTFYRMDDFYYVIQMEDDLWFACDYERFNVMREKLQAVEAEMEKAE